MSNPISILLCDDSALIRKKLRGLLEELGYSEIDEAENGEQALELVREKHPKVVFLDIVMPVKNGIEVLRDIRAFDPSIKVIMASSVGTQANLKEALKLGATDFVQKPFKPEAVQSVLEKALQGEGGR